MNTATCRRSKFAELEKKRSQLCPECMCPAPDAGAPVC